MGLSTFVRLGRRVKEWKSKVVTGEGCLERVLEGGERAGRPEEVRGEGEGEEEARAESSSGCFESGILWPKRRRG